MKTITKKGEYKFHFVQQGGLVQVQLNTIEDVLNLHKLDPKLWTILACPVKGLEFSEETLSILDKDKNGRVRVPEILETVDYVKKYFADPSVIMTEGDTIPLSALGTENFSCGHSPLSSAKALLKVIGKPDAQEISLSDLSIDDRMFSPAVLNGDGVVPPEAFADEKTASVIKDIIDFTGGTDDVSGAKGINRVQAEDFFKAVKGMNEWRVIASEDSDSSEVFFLKHKTDAAASSYMQVADKLNDYFLRCSLAAYDSSSTEILDAEKNALYMTDGKLSSIEQLAEMPISKIQAGKALPLDSSINPAWKDKIEQFKKNVLENITKQNLEELTESQWRKIETLFAPYVAWFNSRPVNGDLNLPVERVTEILSGNYEEKIFEILDKEEKQPPVVTAAVDLKKMILIRRDFIKLLKNFVCFENFYKYEEKAIFQAGTLFLDGRACELCFKVDDVSKHSSMSVLSSCFLIYCECARHDDAGQKMNIAAVMSDGKTDNVIVGRNGLFVDREGNDWDATITKIIDNPVNIKQAFLKPYKKLGNMITEKINKFANDADAKATAKLSSAVNDPKAAAQAASGTTEKKSDIGVGTVAAISVAVTGIVGVLTSLFSALFNKDNMKWIPLEVIAVLLLISLPSMIIAAMKLRTRNISCILDASGWAVNGNVKITPALGKVLTHVAKYPAGARLNKKDPFAQKGFPWKRIILCVVLLCLIIFVVYWQIKNPEMLGGKTPLELIKNLIPKAD